MKGKRTLNEVKKGLFFGLGSGQVKFVDRCSGLKDSRVKNHQEVEMKEALLTAEVPNKVVWRSG
ncbi:expressed protein [Dictyostelium purpureum]|uniref:Expressed protein n=1 Tax=Dictyostelium purpureum TaxID=5786 RepID=F0ZXF6_DICPU|nr:uncharacterized protein DICPUDRAFT_92806 [Dictyostelium purpureum]EGC31382.1 expressed protein [Dictyostelium purpureum]|eukprot:XP_003292103.1 expressed protein [Dictyostelium purpureum]